MKHAIKLSEAFQIVDNGPTKSLGKPKRRHDKDRKSESDDDKDSETEPIKRTKHDPKLPICLYPPHKAKGYWHYLKDCTACSEQEKKDLLKAHAEEKAKTGPSKSTRAQKLATAAAASATASSQSSSGTANQNVTGRLKPVNFEKKPHHSMSICVMVRNKFRQLAELMMGLTNRSSRRNWPRQQQFRVLKNI